MMEGNQFYHEILTIHTLTISEYCYHLLQLAPLHYICITILPTKKNDMAIHAKFKCWQQKTVKQWHACL